MVGDVIGVLALGFQAKKAVDGLVPSSPRRSIRENAVLSKILNENNI